MKKQTTLLIGALMAAISTGAYGQTVVFSEDFGNLANATTITTGNTDLTYVRVGTQGGSIAAVNPSSFGAGASALITGPSGGSLNGLGVGDTLDFGTAPALTFAADIRLTDSSGTIVIGLGTGTTFTGNGTFAGAQGLFWLQLNGTDFQRRTTDPNAWESMGSVSLDTNYALLVEADLIAGTMTVSLNGTPFAEDVALTNASIDPTGFRIYSVNGSNVEVDNITLTAIPEPSFYAALFSLFALAGSILYRRRKA